MLYFQFYYLPGYYQALLIAGMILLTVIELVRLYLGYIGNLKEKVIQTNILREPQLKALLWTCLLDNAAEEVWLLKYSACVCKQAALGNNCPLSLCACVRVCAFMWI